MDCGVTIRGTLRNHYGQMEDKLRKGHRIKVLLVHPDGPAVDLAASRYYATTGRDSARRSMQIGDSLNSLCGLKRIANSNLEIRTIQNPLTFGAICTSPDSVSGALYLEHFPFRTAPDSLPKYVLYSADGKWYDFFRKEILALWECGTQWKCEQDQ